MDRLTRREGRILRALQAGNINARFVQRSRWENPNSPPSPGHYDINYGHFQKALYAQIRVEAFGEDVGQNSWHTAEEQDRFLKWLELSAGRTLLDVACGAGGPVLRIAAITGCSVVGIDVHEQAIRAAISLAAERDLAGRVDFRTADATGALLFSDASFDAITCIDAINHFPNRPQILAEWTRLLKPGGRLLFTDPITVTGPLTNAEMTVRTSAGFYLLVPHGYDERVIGECGLRLLVCDDVTANMANIAEARRAARASRSASLRPIEGDRAYDDEQEFLAVAARFARESRLSRFVYVATKTGGT
jgi:2-polyprenyl-3-methyl-5-hydroxy-6-metoxy-1,4-benzoquinol methylase